MYRLYVDLTKTLKETISGTPDEELLKALGQYMALLNPPPDCGELSMKPEDCKQVGLLAAQSLSRQLYERSKQ